MTTEYIPLSTQDKNQKVRMKGNHTVTTVLVLSEEDLDEDEKELREYYEGLLR